MNNLAIQVQQLSKKYKLGSSQHRYDTLNETIGMLMRPSAWSKMLKKPRDNGLFWALKDITFDVNQGEVLGVIGRNGAGKSTLLKILSRITEPTSGRAVINGRVGSLLEVATGFHPELTGRENVFLNGAILGMKRAEINRKFDDIVSFAEIEQFLDTPVKHYSSGMYVRLAFAVAAHLEPEILLVDEVLAVGDAAFQKKCIGKMGEVSQQGRTILFVSHNMGAVQRLCNRSLMLEVGCISAIGKTNEVISHYLSKYSFTATPDEWADLSCFPREGVGKARFVKISYSSGNQTYNHHAYPDGPLDLLVVIEADDDRSAPSVALSLSDEYGTILVNADSISLGKSTLLKKGLNYIRFKIEELNLAPGVYTLGAWLANPPSEVFDWLKSAVNIEVIDNSPDNAGIRTKGVVSCHFDLNVETDPHDPGLTPYHPLTL